MTSLIFLLSLAATAPDACSLMQKKTGTYFHTQKMEVLVPSSDENSSLVSCREWKDFPGLLIAEVDYDKGGKARDLFVLDTSLKISVFQFTIREEQPAKSIKGRKTKKDVVVYTPVFEKTATGKPQVRIKELGSTYELADPLR